MFATNVGDEAQSLGALKMTNSGRMIAKTWRYGRNTYYSTERGGDGRIERGLIVRGVTQPIDYV